MLGNFLFDLKFLPDAMMNVTKQSLLKESKKLQRRLFCELDSVDPTTYSVAW